ncbi:hypothetical protein FJY94_05020 [Candidatus Kaiserbacteria bacterium]|nr:hypothetical protein [Candidatus Kaiserbacteria bacterium]
MKHIAGDLKRTLGKTRATERGEMMRYFVSKLNPGRAADGLPLITMARMGKMLEQIPTKDLYYVRSVCDKAPNFSKKFWYLMDPEKFDQRMKDGAPKRKVLE